MTHCSEAILLRAWPFRESDLLVSLLTRDAGKVRGVAKSALKSRKRFGGSLEPMTYLRATWTELPRQDVARLDHFEPLVSPLADPVDYLRASALAYYAEVLENVLPDHDPHDAIFRLVPAVLQQTRIDRCWMPLTYFSLWVTRLIGWLPETDRCIVCGESLRDVAFFHNAFDGLTCPVHKRAESGMVHETSLAIANRMLREPASAFAEPPWSRHRARDLRRFLVRTLERHIERRLKSAEALSHLGG